MDEKKKGIIFGTIGLIAGIAMIAYGVINLMGNKEENPNPPVDEENNNPSDIDGPSISTSEDEIKFWLTDNKEFINYFMDYNKDFDLDTATNSDVSDVFAWYFVYGYNHGEGEKATDSKYTYRYTMPKTDADKFMQDYLGVPLDMVDVSLVTFSKDVFNFTSDDNNYYVEVVATGLDPVQTSVLDNINILSDSEIEVTFGIMDVGKTCEDKSDECYTKTRKLTIRKADNGFNILRVNDETNS